MTQPGEAAPASWPRRPCWGRVCWALWALQRGPLAPGPLLTGVSVAGGCAHGQGPAGVRVGSSFPWGLVSGRRAEGSRVGGLGSCGSCTATGGPGWVGSTARQLLAARPLSSWQLRAPGPAVRHLLRPSQRASRAAAGGPAGRTSGGPVLAGRWVPGRGRGGEAERAVSLWAAGHGRSLQGTLRGTLGQCSYPGWMGSPSVRLLLSCRPLPGHRFF